VSMVSLPVSVQPDEVRGIIAWASLVFALVTEGLVEVQDQRSEEQIQFWLGSCE